MKARIIVTPQVEIRFYETEVNIIIIDALNAFESPSDAVNLVITGTIAGLSKINDIKEIVVNE